MNDQQKQADFLADLCSGGYVPEFYDGPLGAEYQGPESICTCENGEIGTGAVFSANRKYRFELWRRWSSGPFCMFLCLNPSTADETLNDPTVTRCINFAKAWGFGAFVMTNIFAFRATDPRVMKAEADPIGFGNDDTINRLARKAGIVVAGWGVHGAHLDRGLDVAAMLPPGMLKCLGYTKDGDPRHPLYLRADSRPLPFPKPFTHP